MSRIEQSFCRNRLWNRFAGRSVLPWALQGTDLRGDLLEIGSGAGAMAEQLANRYPRVAVTASDLDERMVHAARRRLDGRPGIAAVVRADVTALPFEGGGFDVVASFLMLHHVIEWERALAEAFRVLRPNGCLVGYDLLDTTLTRWVHRIDRSPFRLIKATELVPTLERVGFDACRTTVSLGGTVVRFAATKPSPDSSTGG
jgi:ubiquinone/menaquinone biosynthesis C-methylase UbiE